MPNAGPRAQLAAHGRRASATAAAVTALRVDLRVAVVVDLVVALIVVLDLVLERGVVAVVWNVRKCAVSARPNDTAAAGGSGSPIESEDSAGAAARARLAGGPTGATRSEEARRVAAVLAERLR